MVLKEGSSGVLAAVSVSSLFLALSVYFVVDNIARPSENHLNKNRFDIDNLKHKVVNPMTLVLYHQLFQRNQLDTCPGFFKDVCRWNIREHKNTTEMKMNANTTKKLNGAIRRSCQIFGILRYQDVCFYTGKKLVDVEDSNRIAQILKDCTILNDNGYPCVLNDGLTSEHYSPKNVCLSDSKTFKNVVTHRCRVPESFDSVNDSNVVPLEDIIYDSEINTFRDKIDKQFNISGDSNQQNNSNKTTTGTNATTVVCHVLLAALLLVSASVALYEVCRDRFSDKKLGQHSNVADGRINATGSRSYSLDSRRCSLVDLTMSRHVRRESVQHSAVQRQTSLQEPSNSTTANALHSQVRILGARPPPLLRRSSFPVQMGATNSAAPKETPSGMATPAKSLSRRTSVDGSEDDSSPDLRIRRVRFIRRH